MKETRRTDKEGEREMHSEGGHEDRQRGREGVTEEGRGRKKAEFYFLHRSKSKPTGGNSEEANSISLSVHCEQDQSTTVPANNHFRKDDYSTIHPNLIKM